MIRMITMLARRRGIVRDARGEDSRINTTSLKFISIPSKPLKQISSFINITGTKS